MSDYFEDARKPIDIDRAAVFLIKKHGDDSAVVAYNRANCCRCRGDSQSEREWHAVLKRVIELHFETRKGRLQ